MIEENLDLDKQISEKDQYVVDYINRRLEEDMGQDGDARLLASLLLIDDGDDEVEKVNKASQIMSLVMGNYYLLELAKNGDIQLVFDDKTNTFRHYSPSEDWKEQGFPEQIEKFANQIKELEGQEEDA